MTPFSSAVVLATILASQGILAQQNDFNFNSNFQSFSSNNGDKFDNTIWRQFQTFHQECFFIPQNNFTVMDNLRESWRDIQDFSIPGVQFGLNCMSLMSRDTYRQMLVLQQQSFRPPGGQPVSFFSPRASVPDNFDWRDEGFVTPVSSQGSCGSCWAFASTGALEGAIKQRFGNLPSLSEQNLMDCVTKASGCNGGWMTDAYDYVISNGGLENDDAYPYEGDDDNSCRFSNNAKVNFPISGYQYTRDGDEDDLRNTLHRVGPLAAAVDASQMQNYKSGVFRCPGSPTINHGILIVGFGVDDSTGEKFWTIKNSWGTTWGENGFMRIARDDSNSCGISSNANFPFISN